MIERHPCGSIKPGWTTRPADRYTSTPKFRLAIVQLLEDPEFVYIIADQTLPVSVADALAMVEVWRAQQPTGKAA
jgi:hypothetical protein